jgi:hypothetical protein
MIVALRALHLQAEEDLGRLGGRLDAVLLHLAAEKIGGAVETLRVLPVGVGARGGDQFLHETVVRDVFRKRTPQVLPHARPAHHFVLDIAADEDGGPHVAPIAGVVVDVLFAQQAIDEVRPLRGG